MQSDAHTHPIHTVVHRISEGATAESEGHLRDLLASAKAEGEREALPVFVFGAALARRLGEGAHQAANLYLADFDVPQIDLFNLLARHYTPVTLASRLLNDRIARLTAGRDAAVLVDVGIGTGRQVASLIERLAIDGRRPGLLRVIGIEPSGWALEAARQNTMQAAERAGIRLEFHGLHRALERVSEGEWSELRRIGKGAVVNASFALHHVSDVRGIDVRTKVLRRLRALEPEEIVIAEPNVDHHDPRLVPRFANCWAHFGAVFRLIDALAMTPEERDALKVCFFGREILDIVGSTEDARSERHEPVESWIRRLRAAGFATSHMDDGAQGTAGDALVRVEAHAGYSGVDWEGTTSIAVLRAVPVGATPRWDPVETDDAPAAPESRHELDPHVYMDVLAAMAKADAVVDERETAFIERQAALLGVDTRAVWAREATLEEVAAAARNAPRRTREAVVRDAVLLAMIDGHFAESERQLAGRLAALLDVEASILARAEHLLRLYEPDLLRGAPSRFTEYWLLAQK